MAKITITGPVGSGKTTACKLLKEALGEDFNIISVGKLQRDAAAEKGMSITEYSAYRLENPEREKEIDAMLLHYNHDNENYIFDSRLAFHFVKDTFKVALTCSSEIAAQRILTENRGDEKYGSLDEAVKNVKERRENDRKSYINCYGIDINNALQYDCVISTNTLSPKEVVARILKAYNTWQINHMQNLGGKEDGKRQPKYFKRKRSKPTPVRNDSKARGKEQAKKGNKPEKVENRRTGKGNSANRKNTKSKK